MCIRDSSSPTADCNQCSEQTATTGPTGDLGLTILRNPPGVAIGAGTARGPQPWDTDIPPPGV
eukprot:9917033-Alexandrium_andersonii.AAC.1